MLSRDPAALEREALRRAAFIVGTNLLDTGAWPEEAVLALYREQTVVERIGSQWQVNSTQLGILLSYSTAN